MAYGMWVWMLSKILFILGTMLHKFHFYLHTQHGHRVLMAVSILEIPIFKISHNEQILILTYGGFNFLETSLQ